MDISGNLLAIDLQKKIQIGFNNFMEKPIQLNVLRTEHLSKLVTVEGVISQFDEVSRTRTLVSYWQCEACDMDYKMKGAKRPFKCGNSDCGSRSFRRDQSRGIVEDIIDIQLTQQFGGIQKNSTVSRFVTIAGNALVNHILNNVSPGQVVVITGVVRLAENLTTTRANEDIADIELDAFSIEQKNNVNVFDYDERLLNIVKDYINESNIDAHVAKLKRSVCSHIYKQEPIKEAVLLQLVGTNPRMRADGTRVKGDVNILNLGNSGIAKSDYGVFIQMVVPTSMKAGTKSSTSAAGLTTFVDKNEKTGKSMIALGVLALVDRKGVAIIEEINRRDKKDLHEFATATDDNQQIYVNKGGFHTTIYSRCPIYATANSLKNNGIWDDSKTIEEQTNIDRFILSRMDLIFVSHADRSREYKEKLMDHIESQHKKSMLEKDYEAVLEGKSNLAHTEQVLKDVEVSLRQGDFSGEYPIEYLRHELYYLKTIDCQLVENSEAYKILQKFWIDYSSMNSLTNMQMGLHDQAARNLEADSMDIRKFTSLAKLAECYGRLHRCKTVEVKHAKMACELMAISLASQIPKISADLEESNAYADKMMEKNFVKKVADSLDKENQKLKQQVFNSFHRDLSRFNSVIYQKAWEVCRKCHGTGEQAEVIDSETRQIEMYKCIECNGKGGFAHTFTRNDVEADILDKRLMTGDRCNVFFNSYIKKQFIVEDSEHIGVYHHNIDLKSPDVIDSMKKISYHFADIYIEKRRRDEEIAKMNAVKKNRKLEGFQTADELGFSDDS